MCASKRRRKMCGEYRWRMLPRLIPLSSIILRIDIIYHIMLSRIEDKSSVVLKRPKKAEIILGADFLLKCQVSGKPNPNIIWYRNKFRLFGVPNKQLINGPRLRILNVSTGDNGVYSCRAENAAGTLDSFDNFILNVKGPNSPWLLEDGYTPYRLALKHQEARLDCPFEGASEIRWYSRYERLSNNSRHMIYPNGSLYFPKVRGVDEGSYRCHGLNEAKSEQYFTVELALSDLEDITSQSFEPRLVPNFPIVMPVTQPFEIKVFPPSGRPDPDYRWLDQNDRVIGTNGRIRVKNETTLFFENTQEMDSGNYTFVANNTWGERRKNVWVIVS
ncbi:tyrosine-protein kinase-like 7, partial [Plakobranchus ocellatus]